MKKLPFLFITFLLCAYSINAQTRAKFSAGALQYLDACKRQADKNGVLPGYVYKKINNRPYISAFLKVTADIDEANLRSLGVLTGTKAGYIWTAQIPVENVGALTNVNGLGFIDLDAPVSPVLDMARKYTKADSAQGGYGLPMPMSGKDVVVGVIDGGFDFTHPTMYDTTHSAYRVRRVWNQKQTGTPPAGFAYGSELTDSNVIRAQGYDTTILSHATHVTGIAAGSGYRNSAANNRRYRGMAYQSDLVLVGFRADESNWTTAGASDVIDGMNYVFNYATSVSKPCAVNLSSGSYIGPHDGLSLFSQACDALTGAGKIFVCAAGNGGMDTAHLQKTFTATDTSVSTFITFPPTMDTNNLRTWVDVWGDTAQTFCLKVRLFHNGSAIDSAGTCIDGATHNYNLIGSNGDTCFVTLTSVATEYNGKPHALFTIFSKVRDSICLTTTSIAGTVDMWAGFVRSPISYATYLKALGFPWAVSGDANMTLGDIGCTRSAITVGAHTTKPGFTNVSGATLSYPGVFGKIATFSSVGPTRDNRIKPDIAAPGEAVASAVSSYDTSYLPGSPKFMTVVDTATVDGRCYSYAVSVGTSMAAPCVTGIVAMLLQLDPTLTPDSVKSIIAINAIKDAFTGALPPAGTATWGHGKINAYKSLRYMAQQLSVQNTLAPDPMDCLLYPNPSRGSVTIDYVSKESAALTVEIRDVTGRLISTQNWSVSKGYNSRQFHLTGFAKGLYFTKISSGDKSNVIKTVVE